MWLVMQGIILNHHQLSSNSLHHPVSYSIDKCVIGDTEVMHSLPASFATIILSNEIVWHVTLVMYYICK